jgi:hypothetical protein
MSERIETAIINSMKRNRSIEKMKWRQWKNWTTDQRQRWMEETLKPDMAKVIGQEIMKYAHIKESHKGGEMLFETDLCFLDLYNEEDMPNLLRTITSFQPFHRLKAFFGGK